MCFPHLPSCHPHLAFFFYFLFTSRYHFLLIFSHKRRAGGPRRGAQSVNATPPPLPVRGQRFNGSCVWSSIVSGEVNRIESSFLCLAFGLYLVTPEEPVAAEVLSKLQPSYTGNWNIPPASGTKGRREMVVGGGSEWAGGCHPEIKLCMLPPCLYLSGLLRSDF